jgi:hypothetical protein
MEQEEEFDFNSFQQEEAIKGLYAGKPLNGEKGIFAPLLKHFLEAAMAGELEAHLQEEKAAGKSNRKNGRTSKTVKIWFGPEHPRHHQVCQRDVPDGYLGHHASAITDKVIFIRE